MVILVVLAYLVIGAVEMWSWSKRTWKKVLAYLCMLLAALALSLAVMLSWEIPVPQPMGMLDEWLRQLWR